MPKIITATIQPAWRWLTEPNFTDDHEIRRKIRLLLITLILQIGMIRSPLSQFAGLTSLQDPLILTSAVVALTILLAFILARTRYYNWGLGLVLVGQLVFTIVSLVEGDNFSDDAITSSLAWLVIPLLIGSAIFPFFGLLALVGLNLIAIALLPALFPAIQTTGGAIAFFIVISVLVVVINIYRRGLERARRAELAERNQALQVVQASLERRVEERTQELVTVAALTERLSANLNLAELLVALVNRVQELFSYYHVHVYLVDETGQNLVVAEGTGSAGESLKASGHAIPLNAPTSLVAQAARTGQVVRIDDVTQAEDWLANPLLPDTRSEMAVPILLAGEAVGVLDVQQDEVAGLDEADAGVLRALANQVAVAIRNAQAFAQTEAALAEARALQEQYLAQSWQETQLGGEEYHYHRPDAPQPDGVAMAAQSAVTELIKIQDRVIGRLQLQETDLTRQRRLTDQELAFVRAIADQVGQTAESLRLFEETRQQADYERLLGEVTQKIRQAPNLEALAKTAAESLHEVLGGSGGRVTFQVETSQPDPDRNNGH